MIATPPAKLAGWPSLRVRDLDDPRAADYPEDSVAWCRLLRAAYVLDGLPGAFGALHVVRCAGAALRRYGQQWRIESRYDAAKVATDWADATDWECDRALLLMPHRQVIARLLRELESVAAAVDEQTWDGVPEWPGAV